MTVQEIFDIAIHLMDSQNESTGSTMTTDTKEYSLRTPSLINALIDQVYPYSDTYPAVETGANTERPYLVSVTELSDSLDLDNYICRNVLPYGLAALLLTEENPTLANFFWQTYLENLNTARNRLPSSGFESVENVYGGCGPGALNGGIEYGWFGWWG